MALGEGRPWAEGGDAGPPQGQAGVWSPAPPASFPRDGAGRGAGRGAGLPVLPEESAGAAISVRRSLPSPGRGGLGRAGWCRPRAPSSGTGTQLHCGAACSSQVGVRHWWPGQEAREGLGASRQGRPAFNRPDSATSVFSLLFPTPATQADVTSGLGELSF